MICRAFQLSCAITQEAANAAAQQAQIPETKTIRVTILAGAM